MKRSRQALAFLLARLVPLRQLVLDVVYGRMECTPGVVPYHAVECVRLPHERPWPVRVEVYRDTWKRSRGRRPPLVVHRVHATADPPIPTGLFHNGAPQPVREALFAVADTESVEFAVQKALDRLTRSIFRARLGVG